MVSENILKVVKRRIRIKQVTESYATEIVMNMIRYSPRLSLYLPYINATFELGCEYGQNIGGRLRKPNYIE